MTHLNRLPHDNRLCRLLSPPLNQVWSRIIFSRWVATFALQDEVTIAVVSAIQRSRVERMVGAAAKGARTTIFSQNRSRALPSALEAEAGRSASQEAPAMPQ